MPVGDVNHPVIVHRPVACLGQRRAPDDGVVANAALPELCLLSSEWHVVSRALRSAAVVSGYDDDLWRKDV